MKKILIIEDDHAMAITLEAYLECNDYDIEILNNGKDAIKALDQGDVQAILLDLNLRDMHGFDILKHIDKMRKNCASVVITGEVSMSIVIEAMQLGAHDFVPKPVSPERLQVSLKNAIERIELKKIVQNYEKISRVNFQNFIGRSPQMQAVYSILENVAQSKASVFITGESGTGKELAARAIHCLSPRIDKPFEVLNCAAIPHNLLESEIFGHVKGAFTGAVSDRKGAAKRADGGTLFLDEIGEMPMELQAKLLRFIQTGTFSPVGNDHQEEVDVRFVCATNRNPLHAIKEGLLREDLYYRLNVVPVELPPLRERGEDVLILAEYFLKKIAQEEGKDFTNFSKEAQKAIQNYAWPGNVRELENIIRRIIVLHNGDQIEQKMLDMLSDKPCDHKPALPSNEQQELLFLPQREEDIKPLVHYERVIIEAALKTCHGNITKASKHLGINPATIHRKQRQWQEI